MKKIINGKLYDTDTAEFIHSYETKPGIFHQVKKSLYKKTNGEFFSTAILLNDPCADLIFYLESNKEAKYWISEHTSIESYVEIFGPVEE